MEIIRQRKDESLDNFIKRCLLEKSITKQDYILEFNTGIELNTVGYTIEDNNAVKEIEDSFIIKTSRQNQFIPNSYQLETDMEDPIKPQDTVENSQTVNSKEEKSYTRISDPLKFLLEASNKKYHSEETSKQIKELESQKAQLLKNKEKLIERLMYERETDLKSSFSLTEFAQTRSKEKTDTINRIIDLEKIKVAFLEENIKGKQAQYTEIQTEFDSATEKLQDKELLSEKDIYQIQVRKDETERQLKLDKKELADLKSTLMQCHEKIEDLENQKRIVTEETQMYCQDLLMSIKSKYGVSMDENNKMISKVKDIPELVKLEQSIEKVESELTRLTRDPEVIYKHIIEMMENRENPNFVAQEVTLLASTISKPEIIGVLERDKQRYKTTEEKIRELKEEYEKHKEYCEKKDYFKQKEFIDDRSEIEAIRLGIQNSRLQEQACIDALQGYENQKLVGNLRKHIESRKKLLQQDEKFLMNLVPGTEDYEELTREIESLKNNIKNTEVRIEKLQGNKKITNPSVIKRNLHNIQQSIREQEAEITAIEGKDYIDTDLRENDLKILKEIERQIQELESQYKCLGSHTIQELKSLILKDYENILNNTAKESLESYSTTEKSEKVPSKNYSIDHEIETSYSDAPEHLIKKIKSPDFVKRARKTLKSIIRFINNTIRHTELEKEVTNALSPNLDNVTSTENSQEGIAVQEEKVIRDNSVSAASPTLTSEPEPEVESRLESLLEGALKEFDTNPIIEETEKTLGENVQQIEAMQKYDNTTIDMEELLKDTEYGKLYALENNRLIEVTDEEAENYVRNGITVITPYETSGKKSAMMVGATQHYEDEVESKKRK